MSERDELRPASRDVAGEDFLFHLHRGSELLQDNRVHAAKAELEQALSLQPSDPKGQDLLGIVYFRLGLYPRAIAIYERLIQAHPDAIEPRINLALSYLKTGQPAQARGELEKVLEQNPRHNRAWGYLGLAFQRMGDYERASHAFAAGGHDAMARRLLEMSGAPGAGLGIHPLRADPLPPPPPTDPVDPEVRRVAGEAVQVLDRAGGGFRQDADLPRIPSGTWAATEPGREELPAPTTVSAREAHDTTVPPPQVRRTSALFAALQDSGRPRPEASTANSPRGSLLRRPTMPSIGAVSAPAETSWSTSNAAAPADAGWGAGAGAAAAAALAPTAAPVADDASRSIGLTTRPPDTPVAFARDRLLVFPRNLPIGQHPSGIVLVQAAKGFATRLEGVRSLTAAPGVPTRPLLRHTRGRTLDEPLGGISAPICEIGGRCELVLGPPEGRRLQALALADDPLYLREDAVFGFELSVTYENGRLPIGDGEAIPMVQLRGRGGLIAVLPERAAAIEITSGRATILRAATVIGWLGRLVPRALPASEAPAGLRAFVAFAGEGMVIVDGR